MLDWLRHIFWDNEVGNAFLRVILVVLPILMLVPGLIWWERRLLSWMQDRIGPNRVGPFGLLQPIADGVKLFLKEDITPKAIDSLIYFIAPALALFPAFALAGTLPWGPNLKLTPIADVNIGILYVLAVSSLGVYGIVLAGYASNNKYSLMGGLRSSAQLISYELAMGMSLAAIVLATGSLKMTDMVKAQEGPLYGYFSWIQNWNIFTPYGFVAAVVFAICIVAETNRAPFDLPEAENELIAGYHTEYSSMKFAVFFMGEYAAMFVFSGIFAVVFLGGYNVLPINWHEVGVQMPYISGITDFMEKINAMFAFAWFLGKCAFGITVFIWLRATLPRLRYDQLMSLGWRSLLPVGVCNFIVVALWILATGELSQMYGPTFGLLGGWGSVIIAFALLAGIVTALKRSSGDRFETIEKREVLLESGMTVGKGVEVKDLGMRGKEIELAEPV